MKSKKIILLFIMLFFLVSKSKSIDYNMSVDELRKINNDIVGIITIDGISDLIVHGSDNEYYMNHNIFKNNSYEGSVFLDYRVNINDKIIILYGHNSKLVKTTFRLLENYYDKNYFMNNDIVIKFENVLNTYKVVSVFDENEDFSYLNIHISDYEKHYRRLLGKSIFDKKIILNDVDSILIMQTCSYKIDKGYLIIVSKLIDSKVL